MKVCILTLGTRGDVQPYVALAKGLIRQGHSAVICTGESFKSLIEENGVNFCKATSDYMAIAKSPEGKAILEAPMKNIKLVVQYSKEVLIPAYRKTLDEFYEAAKGSDMIIYSPKALGAVDIALHLNIPCVSMSPVPIMYPISEFPNLSITHKNLGGWINKLTYRLNAKAEQQQIKSINDFRVITLGLKERKSGIYTFHNGNKEIPIVYPISPVLFPDVTSWKGHVFLSGFLYLDHDKEILPKEVKSFLSDGNRPIAITFSSMPMKNPDLFIQKLKRALVETSNRAILLVGNSGINYKSDQTLCVVKETSHTALFSRVKGVVHHGGVGTMAAALRAGIPQLIIPFSVDQPFWANRLYKLGYSLKPLKKENLTVTDLARAFREMDNIERCTMAQQIALKIESENGVENLINYLETLHNSDIYPV